MTHIVGVGGIILFALLWCIAYENRCGSSLNHLQICCLISRTINVEIASQWVSALHFVLYSVIGFCNIFKSDLFAELLTSSSRESQSNFHKFNNFAFNILHTLSKILNLILLCMQYTHRQYNIFHTKLYMSLSFS